MNKTQLRTITDPFSESFARAKRWTFLVSMLLVISVATIVFWEYLTFHQILLYKDIGSDTLNVYYPNLMQASRHLHEEGITGWSFYHGLGQGVFPAGMQDPFKWILFGLGSERLAWGLGWVEWAKTVVAGLFFYAFLNCLGISPWARVIGTLLLTFTGMFLLGTTWWSYSYILVLVAFALWSVERYLSSGKWALVPIASALLAGPDYWFYGLFLGTYVLVRLTEQGLEPRQAIRQVGTLVGLGLLGVLISALWFLPTVMMVVDAPRVTGDSNLAGRLMAWPLWQLEQASHYWTAVYRLFSNDLLGVGSAFAGWRNYLEAPAFYAGLLSLLLLPQVFAQRDKPRLLYLLWLGVWVFAVVFPWFRYALSLFSGDYYRTGLSFYVAFTSAYLAIRALDGLVRGQPLNRPLLGVTLLVLLSLLFWPWAEPRPVFGLSVLFAGILVVQAFLLIMLSKSAAGGSAGDASGRTAGPWLLVLLAVVSLEAAYQGHMGVNERDMVTAAEWRSDSGYHDVTLQVLDYLHENDSGFYRIEKTYESSPAMHLGLNDALVQDYYSSPSYSSFNNGNYIRFLAAFGILDPSVESSTRWARGVTNMPLLQGLVATKYMLIKHPPAQAMPQTVAGVFSKIRTFDSVTLYSNTAFVPFGAGYTAYMPRSVFDGLTPQLKVLAALRAAVVEDADISQLDGLPELRSPAGPTMQAPGLGAYLAAHAQLTTSGGLSIDSFSPNRITGTVSADELRILFLPMPLDAGWRATIDGQPADLIMLHAGLAGLPVSAGEHAIALHYRPPTLVPGLLLTLLGLGLYLWLLIRFAGQARPQSRPTTPTEQGTMHAFVDSVRRDG